MSTMFGNPQEALGYAKALANLGEDVTFEQIETEPVGTFGSDILLGAAEKPEATDQEKAVAKSIRDEMAAQVTYRPMKDGAEYELPVKPREGVDPEACPKTAKVHFTIGRFRDGYDCWIVMENGIAHRI